MRPINTSFAESSDPEACRKAYILGYRAGYRDGQADRADGTRQDYDADSIQNVPIEAMKLSTHAYNCLVRYECRYVGDIVKLTSGQIARMRGMGKKSAGEIIQALEEYGITDTDWEFAWLTE